MAFQLTGETNLDRELDPMLQALAQFIADAEITPSGADLSDFGPKNVTVIAPEAEDKEIEEAIEVSVAKAKGLALLIIGGSGKNPDPLSGGPRIVVELELQLYVFPKKRPKGSRTALELAVALMRGLHDAEIRATGFPFYEEIRWTGYDPLPDPDCIAYSLTFDREMQF
jgi:hypothetical protein